MLERKFVKAGKNEEIKEHELKEWKNKSMEERFYYPLYMHLLNHSVDIRTYKMNREFVAAFKRS